MVDSEIVLSILFLICESEIWVALWDKSELGNIMQE